MANDSPVRKLIQDDPGHSKIIEHVRTQLTTTMLEIFNVLLANNNASCDVRAAALKGVVGDKVTQYADRLRKRLAELPHEGTVIVLTKGSPGRRREQDSDIYTLSIRRNPGEPQPLESTRGDADSCLTRFWAPHASSSFQGCIVFGEPYVVKQIETDEKSGKDREKFVRYPDVNNVTQAQDAHLAGSPDKWYLRRGEALAMVHIGNYFQGRLKPIGCPNDEPMGQLKAKFPDPKSPVIIVGDSLSNGALTFYESSYSFRYYSEGGTVYRPSKPGSGHHRIECARRQVFPDRIVAPVLISRRPGALEPGSWITIVASESGRALERAAEILCAESHMESIFRQVPPEWSDDWPHRPFQIILEVTIRTIGGQEDAGVLWCLKKGAAWLENAGSTGRRRRRA